MKTCHLALSSSVECIVATTMLRCTAWLQSIEMILIVSCVQILSLTSMRFRLIQNNLFPVSSLSGRSSSRIHWDPPCPLHSGRVQPSSPITFLPNESGAQWSMMGLIYFHSVDNYRSLCHSLQLMEPVMGEDVRQCNLTAVTCVSCAPTFWSHQWSPLIRITLTDCLLLRKTLSSRLWGSGDWDRKRSQVSSGTMTRVWSLGRQESQG